MSTKGTIVDKDIDSLGNIRVWTQYKIDDIEVKSQYPKKDGKHVFCSRYQVVNFAGMSDAQIKERILKDVSDHTKGLIRKTFIKKASEDIFNTHLDSIINSTVENSETTFNVDSNQDGTIDKKWTVKSDGTKTEEDI